MTTEEGFTALLRGGKRYVNLDDVAILLPQIERDLVPLDLVFVIGVVVVVISLNSLIGKVTASFIARLFLTVLTCGLAHIRRVVGNDREHVARSL